MKTAVGVQRSVARRWRTALLGCLVAVAAPIAMPVAAASAANVEMSGEWELVFNREGRIIKGIAIISKEANVNGEFSSDSALFEKVVPGSFSGTLNGTDTEASVKVTTQQYATLPATEFTSSNMQVQSGTTLSMSGSGTVTYTGGSGSATLVGTRIKTYVEVQERLAREKREREEKEARERREREEAEERENVRGEWSLTLKAGSQTVQGIARITAPANSANEFDSKGALFEGAILGTFSGVLELAKGTVTVTTQATGSAPASKFSSNAMTVESPGGGMSMSGSGTVEVGGSSYPATLTATRTKDYEELVAQELVEAHAREVAEEQEAAERQAKEREAKEREAKEREAREKREHEEALKLIVPPASQSSGSSNGNSKVSSVAPVSQTLTVGATGSLTIQLRNPNAFAVKGHLTLLLSGGAQKASTAPTRRKHGKPAQMVLGAGSFTIAADGRATVKIKLSKAGQDALSRHKTLAALARILTQTSAKHEMTKTYKLTLRSAPPVKHHRR